jgi:hypothetical protein
MNTSQVMCAPDASGHSPHDEPVSNPFLANWRQPGPLSWKLQRLFVNTWTKISRGQRCCGNLGEPGC